MSAVEDVKRLEQRAHSIGQHFDFLTVSYTSVPSPIISPYSFVNSQSLSEKISYHFIFKLTEFLGSREIYLMFKYRKIWNIRISILGIEITNNYIEGMKLKTEEEKM